MIRVNDIFISIQGEGINAGTPALFIRLHGCSMECQFCDTVYTEEYALYQEYDESKLALKIISILNINRNVGHIVITGGEPLEQNEAVGNLINKILHEAKNYLGMISDLKFEIETNGHNSLGGIYGIYDTYGCGDFRKKVSFTISPKKYMGNPDHLHPDIRSILYDKYTGFKHLSLKLLYPYYDAYGLNYDMLPFDSFFVQPMIIVDDTSDMTLQNHLKVIKDLDRYSSKWRLSVQLHKFLKIR